LHGYFGKWHSTGAGGVLPLRSSVDEARRAPATSTIATGALVRMKSQGRVQIRVVGGSSSYLSQSPPGEVWFGAGQARAIDEMEVLWPDGGTRGALGLWRVR